MYIENTKTIHANADWRLFKQTEDYHIKKFGNNLPKQTIQSNVRYWQEVQFCEVIIVANQLKNTKNYTGPCVEQLTNEITLTAAMFPKIALTNMLEEHFDNLINKAA